MTKPIQPTDPAEPEHLPSQSARPEQPPTASAPMTPTQIIDSLLQQALESQKSAEANVTVYTEFLEEARDAMQAIRGEVNGLMKAKRLLAGGGAAQPPATTSTPRGVGT